MTIIDSHVIDDAPTQIAQAVKEKTTNHGWEITPDKEKESIKF